MQKRHEIEVSSSKQPQMIHMRKQNRQISRTVEHTKHVNFSQFFLLLNEYTSRPSYCTCLLCSEMCRNYSILQGTRGAHSILQRTRGALIGACGSTRTPP